MSRTLSDILNASEPDFSKRLMEWDRLVGKVSHDLRLISDMNVASRKSLVALGLDANDTTAQELYFTLQQRIMADNQNLCDYLRITPDMSPAEILEIIVNWVISQEFSLDVWCIKSSWLKTTLKANPPKILMKTFGLRSADSMLKRNSPSELLAIAKRLEKPEWQKKLQTATRKLKVHDFQHKSLQFDVVDDARIGQLAKADYPMSQIISPCPEAGSIMIIKPAGRFRCDVLAITLSLLEAIHDVRRYSAYMRSLGVKKDFGAQIQLLTEVGLTKASREHTHIGWGSVHRHLIGNEDYFQKIEQPHLVHEDMQTPHMVRILSMAHVDFMFWEGLDFVFYVRPQDMPVSLHILDVVTNAANQFNLSESVSTYGKARLWEELWSRHLSHEPLADEVTRIFFGD